MNTAKDSAQHTPRHGAAASTALRFPDASLLPCPFCGSAGKWFRTGRDVGIECSQLEDCHGRAQTDVYGPEEALSAAGQWNHRNDQAACLYETVLETRDELLDALKLCERLFAEALPKFNWGASALDANAISLLNGAPLTVRAAIAKATGSAS